jgi:serine/threonine protein phosphatase PrpC
MTYPSRVHTLSGGKTDVGRKRLSNEDAMLIDDELGLFAVADGMGGHAAGEVASQEALETVHGMVKRWDHMLRPLREGDTSDASTRKAQRLLESAVQGATYMVYAVAEHDPDQHGMGTTLSALQLCNRYGVIAQVGDSRVYLVRGGQVVQLTEDHTLIAWQLKQGMISHAEAAVSPHKNVITRAVGSRDYVQVDTHVFEVHAGDTFLLCTDGLHGYLADDEIGAILQGTDPNQACAELIDMANSRGGRDNITAVVVRIVE